MALYLPETVGAGWCRQQLYWLRARLLALVLGFVVAVVCDALVQISENFATGANEFLITPAQARKGRQERREDSRNDNDGDRQARTKDSDGRSESDRKSDSDGKSDNDGKSNDNDERAPSSTQKSDSSPQGTARNSRSTPQAESAEPPKTAVEAIKRLLKWMQSEPQAIPPWPEAKVTRAIPGDNTPAATREKLAQKAESPKRATTRATPGDLLPQLGTYRPNELLMLDANPAALRVLHARGWRESPGASNAVVRLVSETENSLVARNQLEVEFPATRFGLNFIYSLANGGVPQGSADVVAGARSCAPDRCYGPVLINWRADLASCAIGVKIGVIDTAVDETHPALGWRKLNVHQASPKVTGPLDSHGTGVVSLLAGNPKSGTPGLVPDADYVIANVFFKNASDQIETDTVHLLWALTLLEQQGVHVVNMSLAGPSDELVHRRLVDLSRKGMIFVAAAGNGGPDGPAAYPAAYKNEVIAVTAVDRNQRTYDHASRGDYIDVAAPGVRIWTALPNNREGALSGTSFAAPFVTAIVAAIYRQTLLPQISDPNHSRAPEAVTLAHLSTTKRVRDEIVGLGLVRAPSNCAAVERELAPSAKLPPSIQAGEWKALVQHTLFPAAN